MKANKRRIVTLNSIELHQESFYITWKRFEDMLKSTY